MAAFQLPKIVDKPKKRRGRGIGSGKGGHTTGSGQKGQKSRSGYIKKVGFEGGQIPLIRALPQKRGFKKHIAKKVIGINLLSLSKVKVDEITDQVLRETFGVDKGVSIKLLSKGGLKRKITITGVTMSKGAKAKIEKAGGKVMPAPTAAGKEKLSTKLSKSKKKVPTKKKPNKK
jgi:large subunit ribosomal protein L15